MSSHFKYEIDERNLRLQLKENELSFTEEAWQKFESFAATQKSNGNEAIIKRFHISLNRNVVLPAVFAVVIIMFSLLLFNFINIKNPSKQSAEVASPQTQAVNAEPDRKKPVTPPVQAATLPVETKDPIATQPIQAQNAQPDVVKTEPERQAAGITHEPSIVIEKAKRERGENEIPKTTELVSENNAANATTSGTEEPVKKKRRNKREMIVTEPTQEEAEQLPPPVSENVSENTPQ